MDGVSYPITWLAATVHWLLNRYFNHYDNWIEGSGSFTDTQLWNLRLLLSLKVTVLYDGLSKPFGISPAIVLLLRRRSRSWLGVPQLSVFYVWGIVRHHTFNFAYVGFYDCDSLIHWVGGGRERERERERKCNSWSLSWPFSFRVGCSRFDGPTERDLIIEAVPAIERSEHIDFD